MNELGHVHAVCDWCGVPIYYGNAQVTVTRNVEQMDQTSEYPGGQVAVIQSDLLLALCARCGNRLDRDVLRKVLRR